MNRLLLITSLVLLLLASSCGSHKKAQSQEQKYETVVKNDKKSKKDISKKRKAVVEEAHSWLGTKYRYGGNERSGTDCSGMVMRVYKDAANIKLPRNSAKQCEYCISIKRNELKQADLVFFTSKSSGKRVTHVGIYIGDGKFIHSSTSRGVITSSLDEKYYIKHFHSCGRVPAMDK